MSELFYLSTGTGEGWEQNKIRSTSSKYVHEVIGKFYCQTENICYVVFCKKKGCSLQYIGESKHTAQHRWSQQRLRDRARQSGNWRTFQLQRSQSGRHGVLQLRNIQERSPPPQERKRKVLYQQIQHLTQGDEQQEIRGRILLIAIIFKNFR